MQSLNKFRITTRFLRQLAQHTRACSTENSHMAPQSCVQTPPRKKYGQPTRETHPHLLENHEFIPGLTQDEIVERRQLLAKSIISLKGSTKHLVVVPSARKKYMSGKIPYTFRQNSDFLYLTGCQEPDSCLVMEIDDYKARSTMFMRPRDKHTMLWDGALTGPDAEFFSVDDAFSVGELEKFIERYLKANAGHCWVWFDKAAAEHESVAKTIAANANSGAVESITPLVHRLRLIKSPAEQQLMRRTCSVASAAINETIRWAKPGMSELHLNAYVDFQCRLRDASFLAYPPVVAAGSNATTIHYVANSQLTRPNDLVLMDAGCELGGYTSDITRTWPVGGRFTDPQRVLYEVVLETQRDLLTTLENEAPSLDQLFDRMCERLGVHLQAACVIPRTLEGSDRAAAAFRFCPHHVSHYLGMDVHDTASISRGLPLLPGMVFTVEPGVYVDEERMDVPEEFRGLGIRIEDDVLVTVDRRIEVLTRDCVKEIVELERK